MDKTKTIESLKEKIRVFNEERGWNEGEYPKDIVMSIAIEAAELMEIFQWKSQQESVDIANSKEFEHMKEELADVMIYCIKLANQLNVDIDDAIEDKMRKNAMKYPANK